MAVLVLRFLLQFLTISLILCDFDTSDTEPDDIEQDVFTKILHEQHREPGPQLDSRAASAVQTKWIKQKLDHFNVKETRTWSMRYMVNKEFYKKDGPMFIHVGGEWFITPGFLTSGHVYDMARKHNGYLFYTEHRYYGKSKPVRDLSVKNLRFLSANQSLADLAYFIQYMRMTIPGLKQAKVILSGGSYSGAMVTWFKRIYPDLVTGCWASSAPILAKLDFKEYKQVAGQSIRLMGGEECYQRIHRGISALEAMMTADRIKEFKNMFNICDNFDETNELDVWSLFFSFSNIFAGIVQNHSNDTIQQTCQSLMSESTDSDGLVNYIASLLSSKRCNDMSYKSLLKAMNYKNFGTQIIRQWTYQTCNEFGWTQSSTSAYQPFGTKFPMQLYTEICTDLFGPKYTEEYMQSRVNQTNSYFGGLEPQVKNVYFTHGQLDPWNAAGITDVCNATIIPFSAHCKDFGSISDRDSKEMRESKQKLLQLVNEWLE